MLPLPHPLPFPTPCHLSLTVHILVPGLLPISVLALVDSGASGNFLDPSLLRENLLQPQPHPHPIPVELIDGSSAAPITHFYPSRIRIHGQHTEQITFQLVTLAHFRLVLGFPWLARHNPSIDWQSGALSFTSPLCTSTCLVPPLLPSPSQTPCGTFPPTHIPVPSPPVLAATFSSPSSLPALLPNPPSPSAESPPAPAVPAPLPSPPPHPDLYTQVPEAYHDFLDVFSEAQANTLPPHRKYDLDIPLQPGTSPPWGPIYSMSAPELTAMKTYVKEYLANGFIRPSKSPAAAPVMFVKRPDGKLRLVVDYRGLNKVTVKNRYPLPLIPEMLDRLHRAKVFTKIDLRNAYHQVRVQAGDEWKTAFRCREGHFEFQVCPQGPTNAPAMFQHFMNDILRAHLDLTAVGILDDVIIFSEDPALHVQHVRAILQILRDNRLYAKVEKCEFNKDHMTFVGYMVSQSGIGMDPAKVSAILDWPVPKSVKDVQSFLGFANFYRKFISHYSTLTSPLSSLTRKAVKFTWSEQAGAAFQQLQRAFTSAPVLRHFQPELPLTIEADASDFAIGCILSQTTPQGDLHPVCYYSRKFSAAELNYPIYDKELLAVVEGFKHWRVYVEGAQHAVQVYTDHKNLEYFSEARTTSRRHARWAATMAAYDYKITYRKGAANGKPDALSRRPDYHPPPLPSLPILSRPPSSHPIHHTPYLLAAAILVSPDDPLLPQIAAAQAGDVHISGLITDYLRRPDGESNPALPDGSPSGRSQSQFCMQRDILYSQGRILIPPTSKTLILKILQQYHDSPLAGHYGVARTQALIAQYFSWPGLATAVHSYVTSCDACQRNKVVRHAPFGLLSPLSIPSRPWSHVSLDWITDLPPSKYNDAILVVVDRLTKMAIFIPTTKSMPASDVAALFVQHVIRIHGLPSNIVSDRDPIFTSHFWRRLLVLLGIHANRSTAFHPQTDGQTERLNSVLEQYLRIYCDYQQTDWASLLPLAEFSYNNSKHSATTLSPFFANYGFHPSMSLLPTSPDSPTPAADSYVLQLQQAQVVLQRELLKARKAMEVSANRRRRPAPTLLPGAKVWLLRRNISTIRPCSKLDVRRLGPFSIIGPVGTSSFRLDLPPSMHIHPVFHVSLLEPHVANTFPGRLQRIPPPIQVAGFPEFEVRKILDSKIFRRKIWYFVDWVGYDVKEQSWQPVENLSNATLAIAAFHSQYPQCPVPP